MKLVGHGIDIVEVERIRELLANSKEDFELAWFTSVEQETARQRPDPASFYAGRHAAKEAVLKALGTGLTQDIAPIDVEIQAQVSGAPVVVLSGGALTTAKQLGIGRWLLSISDTGQLAIASALALQDDG
jgi:holo-[acyl-carrier protein] synthase